MGQPWWLVATIGLAVCVLGCEDKDEITPRFAPHVASYLEDAEAPCLRQRGKCISNSYKRGKMVVIDLDAETVDVATQRKLDERIRATNAEEVGMVAFVSWSKGPGGTFTYDDGTVGNVETWSAEVTLVDLAIGRRAARLSLHQDPGPVDVKVGEKSTRPKPHGQLARMLFRVPTLDPSSWLGKQVAKVE